METIYINDGFLQSLTYDATLRKLHVHFADGNYKIFYEVPKANYLEFISSKNHTAFFHENIEDRFPSRTIH